MIVQVFATVMGVLMSLGYYPQIWKIWKTKSAEDISIPTFIIFSFGTASWFLYGWYMHDIVIMSSFILGVIGSWSVLILTLIYRKNQLPVQ